MASGDRYVMTIRGNTSGFAAQIDNVFAYEMVAGTGGAAALNNAFEILHGPAIRAVLSVAYNMVEYYTVNVDDLTDFATTPVGIPGDVSGEALPPFITWTFEYQRTTRSVNNGRKAFSPISETFIAGGLPTGIALPLLLNLADLLEANINGAGTDEWAPRIWKRPGTYASGVVAAPGLFFAFGQVVYRQVSSQNTRKS